MWFRNSGYLDARTALPQLDCASPAEIKTAVFTVPAFGGRKRAVSRGRQF